MNTTNLFVELVVIGAGATLSLLFFILSIFGHTWVTWEKATSSTILIPLLSITYILGIVVDRITDQIYKKWDKDNRLKIFPTNEEYHKARTYIYTHASNQIIALFEYGRSRLRISRSWSINCILLGINIPLFMWTNFPQILFRTKLTITFISILALGIGTLATWSTWQKLALNDYKRLSETYALLMSEKGERKISGEMTDTTR